MEKEGKHLKYVFITINGFPLWVVSQVISRVENEIPTTQINQSIINSEPLNVKQHKLILSYKGKKGEHTLNIKHHITKYLSEHQVVTLVSTGTKLDHKINIKDKTRKEQQHDLTYSVVCPDANYNEVHIHKLSGKDINSHVFKHLTETDYPAVTIDHFRVLKTGHLQKNLKESYLRLYSSNRVNLR